jgi:hypothetical protein
MKLGWSLGNVPQKLKKKTSYKNLIYFGMLAHSQIVLWIMVEQTEIYRVFTSSIFVESYQVTS